MAEKTAVRAKPVVLPKTNTKWTAFFNAKVRPTKVRCSGYKPWHGHDSGCHTNLLAKPDAMIAHISGHGGGFELDLESVDSAWAGWPAMQKALFEVADLRCAVCRADVPINAQHILQHMRNHMGSNKRIQKGGRFLMTITKNKPLPTLEEAHGTDDSRDFEELLADA